MLDWKSIAVYTTEQVRSKHFSVFHGANIMIKRQGLPNRSNTLGLPLFTLKVEGLVIAIF